MASVNRVALLGNCGRDPEVHTFPNGDRVVSFSMAMTETWKNRETGERQSRTEWANIRVQNEGIGKVAEAYVRKGTQLYIEGQLQTQEWTDKEGNKRKATNVVIPRFGGVLTLLSSPKDREQSSGQQENRPASEPRNLSVELGDDVPFLYCWK